jgi:hypothetical protein
LKFFVSTKSKIYETESYLKCIKKAGGSKMEQVQTTIGDLIETITQIALEAGKTEAEGYELASLTLSKILRRRAVKKDK